MSRRTQRTLAALGAVTLMSALLAPPADAYGTRTSNCAFRSARMIVRGTIIGVDAAATARVCIARSGPGSHYLQWAAAPLPDFPAHNMLGLLQNGNVTWGPVITKVSQRRMSPWEHPSITNPIYVTWSLTHPTVIKTVGLVYSYGVRICTITVAGTKHCADGEYKTIYDVNYGLKVCSVAPSAKCGDWKVWS